MTAVVTVESRGRHCRLTSSTSAAAAASGGRERPLLLLHRYGDNIADCVWPAHARRSRPLDGGPCVGGEGRRADTLRWCGGYTGPRRGVRANTNIHTTHGDDDGRTRTGDDEQSGGFDSLVG